MALGESLPNGHESARRLSQTEQHEDPKISRSARGAAIDHGAAPARDGLTIHLKNSDARARVPGDQGLQEVISLVEISPLLPSLVSGFMLMCRGVAYYHQRHLQVIGARETTPVSDFDNPKKRSKP